MKKKLSRILGIGLTAALLASLVLVAAPVSALTQPSVSLSHTITGMADDISSTDVTYSIITNLGKDLPEGGKIVIEFPTGTNLTAVGAGDIKLSATSGIGSSSFSGKVVTTYPKTPSTTTGPTVTITVPDVNIENKIGVGAMLQVVVEDVTNPSTAGDYTLDVSTLTSGDVIIESAVTSAAYTIGAPTLTPLAGIVAVYNPSDILMVQKTGDNAIGNAILAAGKGYTIMIGPGTYSTDTFNTDADDVTFKAVGAAADTIIKIGSTVLIDMDGITLEGLTFKGVMSVTGEQTTITDCIFEKSSKTADAMLLTYNLTSDDILYADTLKVTDSTIDTTYGTADDDIGIVALTDGLTISGSSFMVNYDDIAVGSSAKTTVKDSIFTGSSGVGVGLGSGNATISGNTFDGLDSAININDTSSTVYTIAISGNTITNSTGDKYVGKYPPAPSGGGVIHVENALNDKVLIYGNDISGTDAAEYVLVVEDDPDMVFMLFNNITGNEKNVDDNDASTTKVNASNNWWGDVDGPVSTSISGSVTTSPVLGAPVTSAKVVKVAGGLTTGVLDAKTDVGVYVSGVTGAGDVVIGAASYDANPQASLSNADTFVDVYVKGATSGVDVRVKVYAGDKDAELHAWSTATDAWVKLTLAANNADYSAYGGYMFADIDEGMLSGTPIAVVMAPPGALTSPILTAPIIGSVDISLTPAFSWSTVSGANRYEYELADNANFVLPIVSLTGGGSQIAPFYALVTELGYDTPYFWRVRAIDIELVKFVISNESAWVASVFTTMGEPVEPVEPEPDVWMCSEGLTFDSRAALEAHLATAEAHQPVEPPQLIIPPAEAPLTPGWIYVIIGIGAVLVISLIVLIVRTRRVA